MRERGLSVARLIIDAGRDNLRQRIVSGVGLRVERYVCYHTDSLQDLPYYQIPPR